jgi:hypothetical protein
VEEKEEKKRLNEKKLLVSEATLILLSFYAFIFSSQVHSCLRVYFNFVFSEKDNGMCFREKASNQEKG